MGSLTLSTQSCICYMFIIVQMDLLQLYLLCCDRDDVPFQLACYAMKSLTQQVLCVCARQLHGRAVTCQVGRLQACLQVASMHADLDYDMLLLSHAATHQADQLGSGRSNFESMVWKCDRPSKVWKCDRPKCPSVLRLSGSLPGRTGPAAPGSWRTRPRHKHSSSNTTCPMIA